MEEILVKLREDRGRLHEDSEEKSDEEDNKEEAEEEEEDEDMKKKIGKLIMLK